MTQMKGMNMWRTATALLTLMMLVAACGSTDEASGPETGVDRVIDVEMTEFSYNVDPLTVSAGETITFSVTNTGDIPHEFRLSNAERIESHLSGGHGDHEGSTSGDEAIETEDHEATETTESEDHEATESEDHEATETEDHEATETEDHEATAADVVLELDAGEVGEVTVTFPEDTTLFTEVACLLPGHYESGMNAPIEYRG